MLLAVVNLSENFVCLLIPKQLSVCSAPVNCFKVCNSPPSIAAAASIWLGLNDKANEGSFVWETSGMNVTYTNWLYFAPDNAQGQEDCVRFYEDTGKWNDAPCIARLPFVCEKP